MKKTPSLLALMLAAAIPSIPLNAADPAPAAPPPPNPHIDYDGFLADAAEVGKLRESHRVTEQDFLKMSAEPGTIIFDARNDDKYALLHIKGAVHLDLTNATAADLAKVIPDKTTRILIYCNNNFENEPEAFAGKADRASLNIYTFNTLYEYGYKNVFELGPLLDIKKSILPFEGMKANAPAGQAKPVQPSQP
ncbi:MAG TPA: rhodanese-like domain-containing protein [Chthoniobacteraceae bacterium]|nr:rhodanese-like domain-containing protein [Chthoniobacteraceae bacterium]